MTATTEEVLKQVKTVLAENTTVEAPVTGWDVPASATVAAEPQAEEGTSMTTRQEYADVLSDTGDESDTGPDQHSDNPTPLGLSDLHGMWKTLAVLVVIVVTVLTLLSFASSFHAVSLRLSPSMGPTWAKVVPLVLDAGVLASIGLQLLFARLGRGSFLLDVAPWMLTGATVYLNWSAGTGTVGHVAHTTVSGIYILFTTIGATEIRRHAELVNGTARDRIPKARWLVHPRQTFRVWKGMLAWEQKSYKKALKMERTRLQAVAEAKVLFGWRWKGELGPAVMLDLSMGEVNRAQVRALHEQRQQRREEQERREDERLDALAAAVRDRARASEETTAHVPTPRREEAKPPQRPTEKPEKPTAGQGRRGRSAALSDTGAQVSDRVSAQVNEGTPAVDEAKICEWLDELSQAGTLSVRKAREVITQHEASISTDRLRYLVAVRKNPADRPDSVEDTMDGEIKALAGAE